MIEAKLGKTGSGKSYLCVKEIDEFLRNTDAYIVTNLALKLDELNAYYQQEYPQLSIDVVGRVRLLELHETREFYLHREYGNDLERVTKQEEKILKFPDFEAAAKKSGRPVVYVLDEAHIHWDARAWAEVGLTMNFFLSQHEKFFCHIAYCTQFLKQVELRLREHTTRFDECTNHALRNFLLWKQPKYFSVCTTYKAPPCPSERTERYAIDKKLAACYRTTGGVGVFGSTSHRFEKPRKGLPWWTALAALGVIALIFWFGPDALFNLVLGRVNHAGDVQHVAPGVASATGLGTKAENSHVESLPRPVSDSPERTGSVDLSPELRTEGQHEGPFLVGILRRGLRFSLVFSDGTSVTHLDNLDLPKPYVTSVARNFADVGGVRYHLRSIPRPDVKEPAKAKETVPAVIPEKSQTPTPEKEQEAGSGGAAEPPA